MLCLRTSWPIITVCTNSAVGSLIYSRAMCVWPILMLTRRCVHQIATCKKGPTLKSKDLRTYVYMNLYHCFWIHNSPLKFMSNIEWLCIQISRKKILNFIGCHLFIVVVVIVVLLLPPPPRLLWLLLLHNYYNNNYNHHHHHHINSYI
jgi:hypothetical protein